MDQKLVDAVRGFAKTASGAPGDELGAALLVTRALDDSVDGNALRGRVDQLASACTDGEAPWRYLKQLGYFGSSTTFDPESGSRLDALLERKAGIPISFGVLLIHTARSAGRRAAGVNFPGHFLVRVDETLVDPFAMEETSESVCLARLGKRAVPGAVARAASRDVSRDISRDVSRDAFAEASPQAILLRMLNNLKYQFARPGRWHRALDMVDLQLAVTPDSPHLHLERGRFWAQLGATALAREAFERAVALADGRDGELFSLATESLANLGSGPEVLH